MKKENINATFVVVNVIESENELPDPGVIRHCDDCNVSFKTLDVLLLESLLCDYTVYLEVVEVTDYIEKCTFQSVNYYAIKKETK